MSQMFETRLPSVEALKDAPVYFRYGSSKRKMLVDGLTAQAILACYKRIDQAETRAKFERMVAGSPQQFIKVVDFCWKHVSL